MVKKKFKKEKSSHKLDKKVTKMKKKKSNKE